MPVVAQTFPQYYLNQGRQRQGFINGGFDIWQRGSAFMPGSESIYTADRWRYSNRDRSGTTKVELGFVQADEAPFEVGLRNSIVVARPGPTGEVEKSYLGQRIPGVDYGAGQQCSMSFYAKGDAPQELGSIEFVQVFGSGGTPSSRVYGVIHPSVSISDDYKLYSFSFFIPSVEGKTLGVNNDDYLMIYINLPRDTPGLFYITGMQLNVGPAVLPFQRKSRGEELADCLQFYERLKLDGSPWPITCVALNTTTAEGSLRYYPKWRPPTRIEVNDMAYTKLKGNGVETNVTIPQPQVYTITESTALVWLKVETPPLESNRLYLPYNSATPRYLEIDAEL